MKIDLPTKFLPSSPKIAFTQIGAGDLVILIHGIGGNKENWYQNMEVLSKKFNVVALDLRGYGESEDFLGPMNFSDVADDIQKLIYILERKSVTSLVCQWEHKFRSIFMKSIPI